MLNILSSRHSRRSSKERVMGRTLADSPFRMLSGMILGPLPQIERRKVSYMQEKSSQNEKRKSTHTRSKLTRNTQIKIRLTDTERIAVKKAAEKAGLCLADYLMALVRNKPIVQITDGAKIRSELIREGRNLNYALFLASSARKNGQRVEWQSIQNAIAKVETNLDLLLETIRKWDADISSQVENE